MIRRAEIASPVRLFIVGWTFLPVFAGGYSHFSEKEPVSGQPEIAVVESGTPGPTVLVIGGIHGNELAGVEAAKRIAEWKILRGRLLIIAEANPDALKAQKRLIPGVDKDEADLNRNFHLGPNGCQPIGHVAAQLWKIVSEQSPDWLVDLHESVNFRKVDKQSVGNTVIVCPNDQTVAVVEKLLDAVNNTIADDTKKYVMLQPPAKGSLARAAAETLKAHAMLIETTRREPLETRVSQHCLLVGRLLRELGMIAESE